MFSLACALPSPTSAEDCSSLFGWFIGTTAQSDSSGACMPALWLWAFADRSRSWMDRDAPEVSRFSCMLFLSVRGFLDYAGPTDHSRHNAAGRFAFLPLRTESAPCSSVFRSSIARPTDTPVLRFDQHLAMLTARLGAKMDSLLLSCTTLSFATTCRFNPAHPVKRRSRPAPRGHADTFVEWTATYEGLWPNGASKRRPFSECLTILSEQPLADAKAILITDPAGPAQQPQSPMVSVSPAPHIGSLGVSSRHPHARLRIHREVK
jgi:hypothetical protein